MENYSEKFWFLGTKVPLWNYLNIAPLTRHIGRFRSIMALSHFGGSTQAIEFITVQGVAKVKNIISGQ